MRIDLAGCTHGVTKSQGEFLRRCRLENLPFHESGNTLALLARLLTFHKYPVLLTMIRFLFTNSYSRPVLTGLLLYFLLPVSLRGQSICSAESRDRLDSVLNTLEKKDFSGITINETAVEIGKMFLKTAYVEKTLEVCGDQEQLVINLTGLDCTTFLETTVTLARLAKKGRFTFEDYEKELEFVRYRDGKLNGYTSRMHYFSDWIYNAGQRNIILDITREIGGVPYAKHPTFMSANTKYYPQLGNPEFVRQMKVYESEISRREYYYLPKETVADHLSGIRPGDLIAITIALANLDISHVGIAVEQNGRIHLMHASSDLKKVVISEKPLSDYLLGNKSQSGIMVCRLVDFE